MSTSDEELMMMTVHDVLKKWPQTALVFRKYGLACVGCTIAPYCEIGKVAQIYGLPPAKFLHDLSAEIKKCNPS